MGAITVTACAPSPTTCPVTDAVATTVMAASFAKTTPSDTADALNKLPTILARTPRTQGNGAP
jgi:hypothetical protein